MTDQEKDKRISELESRLCTLTEPWIDEIVAVRARERCGVLLLERVLAEYRPVSTSQLLLHHEIQEYLR